MNKIMDKAKNATPENWNHGYDWDLKPEPPEVEYEDHSASSSHESKK